MLYNNQKQRDGLDNNPERGHTEPWHRDETVGDHGATEIHNCPIFGFQREQTLLQQAWKQQDIQFEGQKVSFEITHPTCKEKGSKSGR